MRPALKVSDWTEWASGARTVEFAKCKHTHTDYPDDLGEFDSPAECPTCLQQTRERRKAARLALLKEMGAE